MKNLAKFVLGIDEAGRGPVIGPMVICGVMIREKDLPELRQIGVKDSKLLSPGRREKLKVLIEKVVRGWKVIKISPLQIDQYGMTYLELKSTAQLINKFSPQVVVIDAPTCWCSSYQRKLRALLGNQEVKLVVENFADRKYPVVSAASILAKVARDKEIEKISRRYGEVGSGYASDARTVEWLKKILRENQGLPDIIRKRWKTIQRVSQMLKKENSGEGTFLKSGQDE